MNISLTKIKTFRAMSRETECFVATICLDGKPVGTVRNDGGGGPDWFEWNDQDIGEQIEKWAAESTGEKFEPLSCVIANLLDAADELKQLKRWTKSGAQTVYRLTDMKPGAWLILKTPFNETTRDALKTKHGDKLAEIANDRFA
jgi:hypothetical protein